LLLAALLRLQQLQLRQLWLLHLPQPLLQQRRLFAHCCRGQCPGQGMH
jgi:hypothetical protein